MHVKGHRLGPCSTTLRSALADLEKVPCFPNHHRGCATGSALTPPYKKHTFSTCKLPPRWYPSIGDRTERELTLAGMSISENGWTFASSIISVVWSFIFPSVVVWLLSFFWLWYLQKETDKVLVRLTSRILPGGGPVKHFHDSVSHEIAQLIRELHGIPLMYKLLNIAFELRRLKRVTRMLDRGMPLPPDFIEQYAAMSGTDISTTATIQSLGSNHHPRCEDYPPAEDGRATSSTETAIPLLTPSTPTSDDDSGRPDDASSDMNYDRPRAIPITSPADAAMTSAIRQRAVPITPAGSGAGGASAAQAAPTSRSSLGVASRNRSGHRSGSIDRHGLQLNSAADIPPAVDTAAENAPTNLFRSAGTSLTRRGSGNQGAPRAMTVDGMDLSSFTNGGGPSQPAAVDHSSPTSPRSADTLQLHDVSGQQRQGVQARSNAATRVSGIKPSRSSPHLRHRVLEATPGHSGGHVSAQKPVLSPVDSPYGSPLQKQLALEGGGEEEGAADWPSAPAVSAPGRSMSRRASTASARSVSGLRLVVASARSAASSPSCSPVGSPSRMRARSLSRMRSAPSRDSLRGRPRCDMVPECESEGEADPGHGEQTAG